MQLELGGNSQPAPPDPLPPRRELEAWRALIPDHIHFGTSTWTYPGWYGQVYQERYPERGGAGRMLAEYARFPLFTTVGIDSMRYYDGIAASQRWGLGHENGVIFVTSRVR